MLKVWGEVVTAPYPGTSDGQYDNLFYHIAHTSGLFDNRHSMEDPGISLQVYQEYGLDRYS